MKIKFEPRDMWIGLYWNTSNAAISYSRSGVQPTNRVTTFYICIIPCFPIIFERMHPIKNKACNHAWYRDGDLYVVCSKCGELAVYVGEKS